MSSIREDLLAVQRELQSWDRQTPSVTGYLVEAVPVGHPLHLAVTALQQHYGGVLPQPAVAHWRRFLEHSRADDEDACVECEWFLEWLDVEIEAHTESRHIESTSAPLIDPTVRHKRSTERGEGQAKLIATLTKHHDYSNGSCLHLEPIGNNELARLAGVDQATASLFFKKQFKGHRNYKSTCVNAGKLAAVLKLLNGEFPAHVFLGHEPAAEVDRDDE